MTMRLLSFLGFAVPLAWLFRLLAALLPTAEAGLLADGPLRRGVLTADAIAGFELEAYGFAMSDEMRTELNERMRHLRLQIKYQMLLSKHYLKPFENLSEAIHHARACGGVD